VDLFAGFVKLSAKSVPLALMDIRVARRRGLPPDRLGRLDEFESGHDWMWCGVCVGQVRKPGRWVQWGGGRVLTGELWRRFAHISFGGGLTPSNSIAVTGATDNVWRLVDEEASG